jgi:hypothetical protein
MAQHHRIDRRAPMMTHVKSSYAGDKLRAQSASGSTSAKPQPPPAETRPSGGWSPAQAEQRAMTASGHMARQPNGDGLAADMARKGDGIVGRETVAGRKAVQQDLKTMKLYNGPIDGVFGGGTKKALDGLSTQRAQGQELSGLSNLDERGRARMTTYLDARANPNAKLEDMARPSALGSTPPGTKGMPPTSPAASDPKVSSLSDKYASVAKNLTSTDPQKSEAMKKDMADYLSGKREPADPAAQVAVNQMKETLKGISNDKKQLSGSPAKEAAISPEHKQLVEQMAAAAKEGDKLGGEFATATPDAVTGMRTLAQSGFSADHIHDIRGALGDKGLDAYGVSALKNLGDTLGLKPGQMAQVAQKLSTAHGPEFAHDALRKAAWKTEGSSSPQEALSYLKNGARYLLPGHIEAVKAVASAVKEVGPSTY